MTLPYPKPEEKQEGPQDRPAEIDTAPLIHPRIEKAPAIVAFGRGFRPNRQRASIDVPAFHSSSINCVA